MAYEYLGNGALDYFPCQYGDSKLIFRGPRRTLDRPYSVVIGGTETFGKFIEAPYPNLLQDLANQTVANLGCMFASPEAFVNDSLILDFCKKSEKTIIQLSGVQNISNRFYQVHPRRNDRFLGATDLLHSIYQDLDFSDVHFTGHLIAMLHKASAKRFEMVRNELQAEWLSRMQRMMKQIGGEIILLWLANHAPSQTDDRPVPGAEPMFLTRQMIEQLQGECSGYVEIVVSEDEIKAGHDRMIFNQFEEAAALQMLGPIAHQEAAKQLLPFLIRGG